MTARTLVDFLRARLDEDEEVARAWDGEGPWSLMGLGPETDYEGRFHPARVLADVKAKRRIVDTWRTSDPDDPITRHRRTGLWLALTILALPYADHPDYQQEWKP